MYKKKLIEVALPLEAINEASRREKSPFTRNHPRAMHVWWARRPLVACRAVLFASLVDDPSANPEKFPTEEAQEAERKRLFGIIEELVKWENSNSDRVLEAAREEIRKSTDGTPPPVLDPFCGGGSIPLEAQRLGLEAHASDLNPVAVLITKALIEIPPKFAGKPPVNPESRKKIGIEVGWKGAAGLAEDIRYYGKWMRDEALERIGHLYPKVKLPPEHGGGEATVITWLWARTVKCPNPACGAQMPLVRSFQLSTKKGVEAWIEPIVNRKARAIEFEVRTGTITAPKGTVGRRGAECIVCENPVSLSYIRSEGKAHRIGSRLMAIVADRDGKRLYLDPNQEHEAVAACGRPSDVPDTQLPKQALGFRVQAYGFWKHSDLFTERQLTVLSELSRLITEVRANVMSDARASDSFSCGSCEAYGDAVSTTLALSLSRLVDFCNCLCSWDSGNANLRQLFSRQTISMNWDYAETNPLQGVVNVETCANWSATSVTGVTSLVPDRRAIVRQIDASKGLDVDGRQYLVSTDPPYYDNIGYAALSDIFYVWLRRSLVATHPGLFWSLLTPKSEELIAEPARFEGDKRRASQFFENALLGAFKSLRKLSDQHYPLTIYYAFKQTESATGQAKDDETDLGSTGWETFLAGLLSAGFAITGTWPIRTEQQQRTRAAGSNALLSSVVLACRPRSDSAGVATRREFLGALGSELPKALRTLQLGNIAPVDLAQAAIGPGMAIFSRYSKVIEADGNSMRVHTALALINQTLDEVLAEQESEFDADTRWALSWFEQHGFEEGKYGDAETLSKAKNTSVQGMVEAGVLDARAGKVRLLRREEMPDGWDPQADRRLTIWEATQHLVRAHSQGEEAAASLLAKLGSVGETARDLAYRLYTICDRKKWAQEALPYNALVIAWPSIVEQSKKRPAEQRAMTY